MVDLHLEDFFAGPGVVLDRLLGGSLVGLDLSGQMTPFHFLCSSSSRRGHLELLRELVGDGLGHLRPNPRDHHPVGPELPRAADEAGADKEGGEQGEEPEDLHQRLSQTPSTIVPCQW